MPANLPPPATPAPDYVPARMDRWYRYEDVRYAAMVDEFENPIGEGRTDVNLRVLVVVRVTPRGVWLLPEHVWPQAEYKREDLQRSGARFVRLSATKQYACPSLEAARISFIARKTAQARIYRARLRQAETALQRAKLPLPQPSERRTWAVLPTKDGSFLEAVRNKKAELSEVDDWVEAWHGGRRNHLSLREMLGMSIPQYTVWMKDPTVLPSFV